MIKLDAPAFVALSDSEQTPKKVKDILVLYMTPEKGKVIGWLRFGNETENGFEEVYSGFMFEYEQSYFVSTRTRVLNVIQDDLKSRLETLNPGLTFTIE